MVEGDDLVTSTLLLSDDSHRCGVFQELMALTDANGVDFVGNPSPLLRAEKAAGSPADERPGMERSSVARLRQAAAFILTLRL